MEDKILDKSDMEIIEEIANKYCITVLELGRIISRKKQSYPRLQILLSKNELEIIDKKAKEKNISRSKYCSMCFKKALTNKEYENLDVMKIIARNTEGKDKREERAVISFDNANDYKEIKRVSKSLGIPCSALIRYFTLNVEL